MSAVHDLQHHSREVAGLVAHLRDLCGDDDQAFLDTLEGETEAVDAARRVVRWINEQSANATACKELASVYGAREKAFADRIGRARAGLLNFMQEIGVRSLPLPEATLSIAAGRTSVAGEPDASSLPDELVRIKREPDKTAIKAALERGETVPGCTLSNSPPTLTIRIK